MVWPWCFGAEFADLLAQVNGKRAGRVARAGEPVTEIVHPAGHRSDAELTRERQHRGDFLGSPVE